MGANGRDLRLELVSLAVVVVTACLLSPGSWRQNRFVSWLLSSNSSFENIYQLLPILQKNSRVLFVVFNDLASAINSVAAPHNGDTPLSKESVRSLLNQEWVQLKLRKAQDSVLSEFGLDAATLDKAIDRFRSDDQVQMYINGVELMYNAVLDGGYPQCPGVERCEGVTKQFALSVVEKIAAAKQRLVRIPCSSERLADSVEVDVVFREMQRFGYTTPFDAYIAFKNAENCYLYDFAFVQARQSIYMGCKSPCSEAASSHDPDVPRVTVEELQLMLETMDADAPFFLLLFDTEHLIQEFLSFVKGSAESEPKAVVAWMYSGDSTPEYSCDRYPAALRFRGGRVEEVLYEPSGVAPYAWPAPSLCEHKSAS
ncbi:hypothetical protein, conserved [Babesia bigemina]|uniref:Uncharacterized protein n=1 Tax=Babesia bigemina TaxID=5866 RepID=A0A061D936_BABBI|nr:hypothetical protein, conserved [Babesia bigemina]CDR95409.1 hypothetical protein, conserved [Babesia bigemina]|eukprot:XP_012767595.1 hypothetical protein, conserved [Babesia bigemina]